MQRWGPPGPQPADVQPAAPSAQLPEGHRPESELPCAEGHPTAYAPPFIPCPSSHVEQGFLASLELLPMWGGVDPDTSLYASGRVLDDAGDWASGQATSTDAGALLSCGCTAGQPGTAGQLHRHSFKHSQAPCVL